MEKDLASTYKAVEKIKPGSFEAENHYYPRVLNAQIHPLVSFFLNLELDRIKSRYLHLHPKADPVALESILTYQPKHLNWAGADLFKVSSEQGIGQMILIETNSCPSGQKSMPLLNEMDDQGGYKRLLEKSFIPLLKKKGLPPGKLAVIYDKNFLEASGYAHSLADLTGEDVFLVKCKNGDKETTTRFNNEILEVFHNNEWLPIRCAFRYVTQKPWNRIPIHTKTKILNPVLCCLAGGRNKLLAAKAYDLFNSEYQGSHIQIQIPETIWDVSKLEVPLWVQKWGGHAVVKNPYSNAGQGVYTITSKKELDHFLSLDFDYDQFIVQSLIGNNSWSSHGSTARYFHVGTVPTKKGNIYVADLRMMVCSSRSGFHPLAIYSRRSHTPLQEVLDGSVPTWDMLGTNLSVKNADGSWSSDTNRLLLMDRKDFNKIGLGLDDLIEAFLQTVFSLVAIDKLACMFINSKGRFRKKLFQSMNRDENLINEILYE